MAIDWEKIKDEYMHSTIGLRPLAAKYGVTERRVSYRAKQGSWYAQKLENLKRQQAFCKENQAFLDAQAGNVCQRDIGILAEKLYQKAELAIDALDGAQLDTQRLRHLVQSVKDLKDLVRPEDEGKGAGRLEALVRGLCQV